VTFLYPVWRKAVDVLCGPPRAAQRLSSGSGYFSSI